MAEQEKRLSPIAKAEKALRLTGWKKMAGSNPSLWETGGGAAPYCVAVVILDGNIIQATYSDHKIVATNHTNQEMVETIIGKNQLLST